MPFRLNNDALYIAGNIRPTLPFFTPEKPSESSCKDFYQMGGEKLFITPFTPYQNIEDFTTQLVSPLGMFGLSAGAAISLTVHTLELVTITLLEASLSFDSDISRKILAEAVQNTGSILNYITRTMLDPLYQTTALVTRAGATAISASKAALDELSSQTSLRCS